MDRLIALLAALVALISLGGALLVHNNATAVMTRQAGEIAQLKASLTLINQQQSGISPSRPAANPAADGAAEALLALQNRVASLEATTRDQASALDAARAALAEAGAAAPVTAVALADQPAASPSPAALSADGPTEDCIPLGTRFMAQAGDSFPICRTKVVVDVADVAEGSAMVEGAPPIAAGGFGNLPVAGCTLMVFSADVTGFAEMRVSCT